MTPDTLDTTSMALCAPATENSASSSSPVEESGESHKKRPPPTGEAPPHKVTKRRAARACVSCRARKVRCDVVEGAPCGNCRWDNVECVVQESRRRKKTLSSAGSGVGPGAEVQLRCRPNIQAAAHGATNGSAPRNNSSVSTVASSLGDATHVPHLIYQRSAGYRQDPGLLHRARQPSDASLLGTASTSATLPSPQFPWNPSLANHADLFGTGRCAQFLSSLEIPDAASQLPPFVRPLPPKIAPEDVGYLDAKGALTLPALPLQSALLQSYIEYVHPYMPLMNIHDFLDVIGQRDGLNGQTSLLLYQAIMFAATAFVDIKALRDAGYATRKAARKAFFQKTRLLYDFDYESDRLVLVQALMLMTYWYETPDDQKDTWHWMGVAISLAHTIGLHRNPEATSMSIPKQRLWKRIWWSCFMRDRLIALGMRRPTRIKDEDFDVPMLVESDFEYQALSEVNSHVLPASCTLIRDVAMQKELAVMCIAKAKICICISHMLKTQYSVLIRDKMKPENTTNSTMMLFPNKKHDNLDSVTNVDLELSDWIESLPACCRYRPLTPLDVKNGRTTLAVQRTLLHMVYHTTVSALHRPQFLPSSPSHTPTASRQVQDMSRLRVRDAATQITRMATELFHLRLERLLPTTGVTVILPAMIIHLLEMKNPVAQARERATRGFRQCMRVMDKLREIYAAADYATGFLDAALRKAAIDINISAGQQDSDDSDLLKQMPLGSMGGGFSAQTPPPENVPYMTVDESLFQEKPKDCSDRQMLSMTAPESTVTVNQQLAMMPPNTINAAALELSTHSPPHTDFGSSGVTPSVSGGSDVAPVELDALDLDFMQGHDEFDWNAVAGTDFDVDQWLQFPPEGVTGDDIGSGLFSSTTEMKGDGATDAMDVDACGGENEDTIMERVLSLAVADGEEYATMVTTDDTVGTSAATPTPTMMMNEATPVSKEVSAQA